MQYTFLGMNVCRDAFLILTGLGVSSLQAAREQALAGKVSWSSRAERGLHGGDMANNNKAASYLGARAWLEWYAETHAEMSPTEWRAYLPAGRRCFYYAHYRRDTLERYGVTEEDCAHAKAYALASRQLKKQRVSANAEAYASASRASSDLSNAEAYASAARRPMFRWRTL